MVALIPVFDETLTEQLFCFKRQFWTNFAAGIGPLTGGGHGEGEGTAFTGGALDADLAADELDEAAGDVQAQAPTGLLADAGFVGAEELVEQPRLVGRRNAIAGVRDGDAHLPILGPGRKRDGRAAGRVLV